MKAIRNLYFSISCMLILAGIAAVFILSLLVPFLLQVGLFLLILFFCFLIFEAFLLFSLALPIELSRTIPAVMDTIQPHLVTLRLKNLSRFNLKLLVFEDLPEQLQLFDWNAQISLKPFSQQNLKYSINPLSRGVYKWENSYLLIRLNLPGLVKRKLTFEQYQESNCMPSFASLANTKLNGIVNDLRQGYSNIRKLGTSFEFEQIKEYQIGDDYRHVNWKASAKKGQLMLNQFIDERSQNIFCAIDMGRNMLKMHNGRPILDYAIHATLALSRAVIEAQDKIGLINFYSDHCQILKPEGSFRQLTKMRMRLFNLMAQETEPSFEMLYKFVRIQAPQRSLIIVFTYFANQDSVARNISFLQALGRFHLVLLVIFKNTELNQLVDETPSTLREVYTKTIAQEILHQQEILVRKLNQQGILSLITEPEALNNKLLNKYLEIKKKQMI